MIGLATPRTCRKIKTRVKYSQKSSILGELPSTSCTDREGGGYLPQINVDKKVQATPDSHGIRGGGGGIGEALNVPTSPEYLKRFSVVLTRARYPRTGTYCMHSSSHAKDGVTQPLTQHGQRASVRVMRGVFRDVMRGAQERRPQQQQTLWFPALTWLSQRSSPLPRSQP